MARVRKFSGCIRAAEVNEAGQVTGKIFDFGNLATLGLELSPELIKVTSTKCDSAGSTIASMAKPTQAGGTLNSEEWMPDVIIEALNATVSTQGITASTLTDEDVTLAGFGYWAEIGTKRLSSVVVTDAGGTNTLVAGVDYVIDPYMGLIKPVKGSTFLTTGTEHVLVDATAAADDTPIYTIAAGSSKTYKIFGHLKDSWSGKEGELMLRKVRLVLSSEIVLTAPADDEKTPLEFEISPEIVDGVAGIGIFAGEVLA